MKCEKCGEILFDGDVFCTNCGAPINRGQGVSPTVNPMQLQQPYQQQVAPTTNPFAPQQQLNPYQQALVSSAGVVNRDIEDNKTANKICGLSLFLRYGAPVVISILSVMMSNVSETIGSAVTLISPLCSLAAFVLMIYARVKYPNNTFAKVLMWLYIASLIVTVVIFIFIVAACVSCASQLN